MATRRKKLMAPIIKEECNKAFLRGFQEGKTAGWDNRMLAYENEMKCLNAQIDFLLQKNKELKQKCLDYENKS